MLPKWVEFKRELTTQPTFIKGKLIIFTEFADTARHLAERIEKEVDEKTLLFSSASSPELRRGVIANFDANSQSPSDNYRILVTTDVLAEGVNLHRSATVINYDLPWNPSRMMQRVGRVNRVGTRFTTIGTYNFFPTAGEQAGVVTQERDECVDLRRLDKFFRSHANIERAEELDFFTTAITPRPDRLAVITYFRQRRADHVAQSFRSHQLQGIGGRWRGGAKE